MNPIDLLNLCFKDVFELAAGYDVLFEVRLNLATESNSIAGFKISPGFFELRPTVRNSLCKQIKSAMNEYEYRVANE